MATKRFKELKSLSKDELATKLRELEHQFFDSKMKHVTGQLENTASLWQMRKDIARVKMLTAAHIGAPANATGQKPVRKAGLKAGQKAGQKLGKTAKSVAHTTTTAAK